MIEAPNKMRSWLFAPGDSETKMAKAADGPADIVVLDLEDAVVPERKALARTAVHDFLARNVADRARLWVRVNPLDGPHTLDDLGAVIPARPGGIMLPKIEGRVDLETFDKTVAELEVANGIERRSTPVIALVTETPQAMFHAGSYRNAPRLIALTWGAEDLSSAIGAGSYRGEDGSLGFTYELARSLCLLGASAAGLPAIETVEPDFRDLERLRARAERVSREGFRGMLAIHPAQVEVINAAFTPGPDEVAEAQEIVAMFEANPEAGTLGYRGRMLDLPHLARARRLLASLD